MDSNGRLLQLFDCIESIKSDVKKKMMSPEHATDVPKLPESIEEEVLSVARGIFHSDDEESCRYNTRIPTRSRSVISGSTLPLERVNFNFSLRRTSIIEWIKIIAGARIWLLSTMSSSSLAVARP